MLGIIEIIAIVIFIVFMPIKFVSDYHRIFKPWKEQKINQVKEWNRQRNNRTRELKKQIKDWNNRRNNKTRELIKKIKDWNNQRNQKLRAWKERRRVNLENFKAWWDKDVLPEWEKATSFKRIYIVFSCIIGVILAILFLALCSQIILLPFGLSNIDEINSNFALAFLGTISGGVALFTGYIAILRSETNTQQNKIANDQSKIADKQAITAEQGLITDRINKATEGLGKINGKDEPLREVRLGALYALERIAQDSLRDHIRIMKIICAYIRVRNQLKNSRSEAYPVSEDVRAALIIIGQRGKWTKDQKHLKEETDEKYKLDLRHCNLHNASLNNANLRRANLVNATLEISVLTDADFTDAHLQNTNLTNATLTRTDFKNAYTGGSFAYEGDFSTCLNLTQEQLEDMYCGKDVVIFILANPNNLTRPLHWSEDDLTREEFMEAYEEWEENRPK